MTSSSSPVGIFDSGFGGLTVMRAISDLLPHENIIYLGDTANLPYGTKSKETIERYTKQNIDFLIQQGVKTVVIACHTASCLALETVKPLYSIPLLGVSDASIELTVQKSPTGKIGILGTRGTIASKTYQNLIQKKHPGATIIPIACQLLVNLVEEGYHDHPLTTLALKEYLLPLANHPVESILLGCTHFPLLSPQIQAHVGSSVHLIDPGKACASALQQKLQQLHLLNTQTCQGYHLFYASDDPDKFQEMGSLFFSKPLSDVNRAFS